ncbi:hypothetical protein HII13_001862 [Brettanomyces bruxellensis]|nr:hypothetical protein HII13_001862 [Brettanomyces bruxellensis]
MIAASSHKDISQSQESHSGNYVENKASREISMDMSGGMDKVKESSASSAGSASNSARSGSNNNGKDSASRNNMSISSSVNTSLTSSIANTDIANTDISNINLSNININNVNVNNMKFEPGRQPNSAENANVKWVDVIEGANLSGTQAFDLLSTYTNLITSASQSYEGVSPRTNVRDSAESSKVSTPVGKSSISQPVSQNPSAADLFGANFGPLDTSTDMDILQGGFANTANPPTGIGPYVNANSSSTSLAHVPSMSKSSSRSTALPGDEYTPLISPAVTPLERATSVSRARKVGFSPLTSPALEFQHYHSKSVSLRQKRKDHQDDLTGNSGRRGSSSSFKRSKTPSTTPLMGPVTGRVPASAYGYGKSKSQYLYRHPLGSKHVQSQNQHIQNSKQHRRSSQNSLRSQDGVIDTLSDEMMLPPSSQQQEAASGDQMGLKQHQTGHADASKGPAFATPATLMSFPVIGAHHARNSPRLMSNDNVFANPRHNASSAQSSPVILPSSSSAILLQQQQQQQQQQRRQKFLVQDSNPGRDTEPAGAGSGNGHSSKENGPAANSSPTGSIPADADGQSGWPAARRGSSSSGKSNCSKKMNHKLAEQGRRNRMNVAIQELDNLIPDTYKDGAMVPSKATTVEMSSKYIRDLQTENKRLCKELEQAKAQLEKYIGSRGASTVESGSSISPLEYLDGESGKKSKDLDESA